VARTHQGKGNFEGMFVQYSERAQDDARLCAAEGRQPGGISRGIDSSWCEQMYVRGCVEARDLDDHPCPGHREVH
jgi:hypothetical protein